MLWTALGTAQCFLFSVKLRRTSRSDHTPQLSISWLISHCPPSQLIWVWLCDTDLCLTELPGEILPRDYSQCQNGFTYFKHNFQKLI